MSTCLICSSHTCVYNYSQEQADKQLSSEGRGKPLEQNLQMMPIEPGSEGGEEGSRRERRIDERDNEKRAEGERNGEREEDGVGGKGEYSLIC